MATGAQVVVTLNLEDFPIEACEPFAIEPLHPDVFVLDLDNLDGQAAYEAVERQVIALTRPPTTLDDLLDRLTVSIPDFARRVPRLLGSCSAEGAVHLRGKGSWAIAG